MSLLDELYETLAYIFKCIYVATKSPFFGVGKPVGLKLVIEDCCEGQEVVPIKLYFGGHEGAGQYIWYRSRRKLEESELGDLLNSCEDAIICDRML